MRTPLHPAALASVPYGIVLVRVRSQKRVKGRVKRQPAHGQSVSGKHTNLHSRCVPRRLGASGCKGTSTARPGGTRPARTDPRAEPPALKLRKALRCTSACSTTPAAPTALASLSASPRSRGCRWARGVDFKAQGAKIKKAAFKVEGKFRPPPRPDSRQPPDADRRGVRRSRPFAVRGGRTGISMSA